MHGESRQHVLVHVLAHAGIGAALVDRDEPARAVVGSHVAEISNRRRGFHRTACCQHAQALDFATGKARIYTYGVGGLMVAGAKISGVLIESTGLARGIAIVPAIPAAHGGRTFDGIHLPARPAIWWQREFGRTCR